MWIARDKDGRLFLFLENKPEKSGDIWTNWCIAICEIDKELFPEVKWEDDEPTEVVLTLKDRAVKPRGNFGQWTDAKTLPPEGEDVLIQFIDGSCIVGYYGEGRDTCQADCDKIVWRSDGDDYWYHEAVIKSWMPLPER